MLLSDNMGFIQPKLAKTLFIVRAMHQIKAAKRACTFLDEGTNT